MINDPVYIHTQFVLCEINAEQSLNDSPVVGAMLVASELSKDLSILIDLPGARVGYHCVVLELK